ncbi:hypothetical protein CEUSTIGMA_g204.t1 [Chlamydomonas eustigma]|uniref:FAST kinase leucine-rich domain-containing protein n=1 Tax=Chlamydomonas eustigma TaxID=1157962 RepID=A0A250WPI5_9CHLO|nr:hypothetical protein CEUSTIGMA_g204.t1 [Chlamydomonas eustigma]|eukprot:GAX72748.1 hypothetical protein CEUSTIGMA_g204.t1 [Chlamydomonas eustigma]
MWSTSSMAKQVADTRTYLRQPVACYAYIERPTTYTLWGDLQLAANVDPQLISSNKLTSKNMSHSAINVCHEIEQPWTKKPQKAGLLSLIEGAMNLNDLSSILKEYRSALSSIHIRSMRVQVRHLESIRPCLLEDNSSLMARNLVAELNQLLLHRQKYGDPLNVLIKKRTRRKDSNTLSTEAVGKYPIQDAGAASVSVVIHNLYGLAKGGKKPEETFFEATMHTIEISMLDLEPKQLSSIMWSLAKLEYSPCNNWMRLFYEHSLSSLESFGPRELCTIIWALATLQLHPHASWLKLWVEACRSHLSGFSPRDLSQTLWAFAKLQYKPGVGWNQMYLRQCAASAGHMHARDISNILWACARLDLSVPESLVEALLAPLVSSHSPKVSRLLPRDSSEMLWAIGRLKRQVHPRFLHFLLSNFAQARPSPKTGRYNPAVHLCPQDVVNVCWSLASLSYQPHPSVKELLIKQACWAMSYTGREKRKPRSESALVDGLIQINSPALIEKGRTGDKSPSMISTSSIGQSIALPVTLWSLTRLGWARDSPLLLTLAAKSAAGASILTPQGLALILYCLARNLYRPRQEVLQSMLHSLQLYMKARAEVVEAVGHGDDQDGIRAQTAAMLLWSLGKLGFAPSVTWIRELLVHTVQLLPHATGEELCNLAKGLALLGYQPDSFWLQVFSDSLVNSQVPKTLPGVLRRWKPLHERQLSALRWALPRLGLRPDLVDEGTLGSSF